MYLQQLRLPPSLLSLLSFSQISSSLLRTVSVAPLLAAGSAQSSHPLAHIDSEELGAPRGGGAATGGGAGGERRRGGWEDEGLTQGTRARLERGKWWD